MRRLDAVPDEQASLSCSEVADLLGASPAMVRRLAATGRLQVLRRGKPLRFRPDDVGAFIEASRVVPGGMAWAWQLREESRRPTRPEPSNAENQA